MQQKDVIVGNEYNIQLEGKTVRVKVLADRGYGSGNLRKYQVKRLDTGRVLPKFRTCQALSPIAPETNHAGH